MHYNVVCITKFIKPLKSKTIFMKITFLLFLLFLTSCSSNEKIRLDFSNLGEMREKDYVEHLASVGEDYLSHNLNLEIKLGKESEKFLEQVYERIVSNNEIMLAHEYAPSFHIIKGSRPFLFSLPHSQFFISNVLIEKYLKSEELFVAALSAEIIKSNRNIYEKRIMIPLGFYNTEKLLLITRLKEETKYKLNEWTYFILKRAGYDSTAYLNWIQIQNRNSLEFSYYLGDSIGISKEEHYFKNFMTKQGVVGFEKNINEANSSKAFYKLLNNIVSNK